MDWHRTRDRNAIEEPLYVHDDDSSFFYTARVLVVHALNVLLEWKIDGEFQKLTAFLKRKNRNK